MEKVKELVISRVNSLVQRLHTVETREVGTAWLSFTYTTGWGDFGSGFLGGQYKRVGSLVHLAGMVIRSSGSSTTITTLPVGYRPASSILLSTMNNSVIARVDVTTGGAITWVSGNSATQWTSLNGLFFPI